MACISTKGMYQRPRNDTISVHFLKKPAGGVYLWGLYHGVPHTAENCTRWVWHDNCREPVKKSSAAWCAKYKHKVDTSFESAPLRAEDKKAARRAAHIKRIPQSRYHLACVIATISLGRLQAPITVRSTGAQAGAAQV
eukprot:CAMPEP_0195654872 /NCGR_PEP_ID=MMETSP0815-20121206/34149_1 /TAXON_ID=97485 /ORGANISM="Prymnesium parvum, Strain Texoma1" /LENGTH=137 /DNA_ID=CAMNT_0040799107 /DNA_START=128 /DNA_END=541 /DNA_ORIENTATION=+